MSVFLKTPVMGQIRKKSSIARFCRTLGTLVGAGVPILEAINITKETSGNEVFAGACPRCTIRFARARPSPSRSGRARWCDGIVVNMISVGEETGELDAMLIKIADNYDEEVETLVGSLISLLEPIMVACWA
jgi:type IV pilus assembly protein PilC